MVLLTSVIAVPGVSSGIVPSSTTLAWDASTDPTVTGYKLYYGVASRNYTNSIDAGSATSATVLSLTSGLTYYFAATTYNAYKVESTYSAEITLSLVPTNTPPTLDPIADMTISENAGQQTVNLTGISPGATNTSQSVTVTAFSSDPTIVPNPTVNYTSPSSTGTLSFAPVTNAFGQVTMTVMVDNGNTVSNTVIRSFAVTVTPLNNPPTLDPIPNLAVNQNAGMQTVNLTGISTGATNENQTLTITAVSSNPTLIPNPTVNYISPNATGTLTFTPVANAFGGATVTVSISDGQPTNSTTAQSFIVTVNQVVVGPAPVTNAIIYPNTAFRFVLNPPVTNNDQYSYSLGTGAPTGAKIITRRGISSLVWAPSTAYASTTNDITVVITDSTTPALSTNEVVRVIVLDYLTVNVGRTVVQAGQSATVPIYLGSSDSVTNLAFNIGWPASRFANPSLSIAWTGVASNSLTVQNTNLVITLAAPSKPLQGSNLLGQLTFQTVTTQHSAFVGLPAAISLAVKPGALSYSNCIPQAGRVVLVSDVPLLEGFAGSGRSLNLYGIVGKNYQLQYCTNLVSNATWYGLNTYNQTNLTQPTVLSATAPNIVYRLRQQ